MDPREYYREYHLDEEEIDLIKNLIENVIYDATKPCRIFQGSRNNIHVYYTVREEDRLVIPRLRKGEKIYALYNVEEKEFETLEYCHYSFIRNGMTDAQRVLEAKNADWIGIGGEWIKIRG